MPEPRNGQVAAATPKLAAPLFGGKIPNDFATGCLARRVRKRRAVGAKRVIWHVGFERNIHLRGPRSFDIRSEVQLSSEPSRLDYLLVRKLVVAGVVEDDSARTLRGLWPRLPRVSVVEYKSPGRPYRPGNLDRLWGYVHTYFADQRALPRRRADGTPVVSGTEGAPDVWTREDLCAVLVVPSRTQGLDEDAASMGLAWEGLGGGSWGLPGGLFVLS